MTRTSSRRLLLIGCLSSSIAIFPTACSGSFATRSGDTATGETSTDRGDTASVSRVDVVQAELPEGAIDPDEAWEAGDAAFQSGNFARAQNQFGLVYIHDPNYRRGQIHSALDETCHQVGNDCALVLGRLDTLRVDYANLAGPRDQWFPQQESDYRSILACYDLALADQLDEAYERGYRVVNAPLPLFAQLARVCVDRVQQTHTHRQMAERREVLLADWDWTYQDFMNAHEALAAGIEADDWDAIVDTYPQYKIAEEPIIEALESGLLENHPRVGEQVAQARQVVDEVRSWEDENLAEYELMREAIIALEEDPDYNQALIQYQEVFSQIPALQEEIETLQTAREATEGRERRAIGRRIDAKEAEIREIRRELRRLMGTINAMRREWQLPTREEPYGLEY